MADLKIWFLDVGHGDCAYAELPNGARMMIDCGCGDDHWPSRLLKHYKLTKGENPAPIPNHPSLYALDKLVISHPHGDHFADIESIHDDIGFCWLVGAYNGFIDKISTEKMDFRKQRASASTKFVDVVKRYTGQYVESEDRIALAKPACIVETMRFLDYEDDMDLNELSWFVSIQFASHKILFTGDMTYSGVNKILASAKAESFKQFVRGTTILKVPHHGRENGCSQEMMDAFGGKPWLCVASDEVLNEANEGTSNIEWYSERTSDVQISIDGVVQNRKVLTTRKDKDIFVQLSDAGHITVATNCFRDIRDTILTANPPLRSPSPLERFSVR